MKEIWKPMKGWESLYIISNFGRVMSLSREVEVCRRKYGSFTKIIPPHLMTIHIDRKGYGQVQLTDTNKKKHSKTVHRLVALTFISNPENLPQINHKDENKLNNRVDNLEWCDNTYNVNYGTRNGTVSEKLSKIPHSWRWCPIVQHTLKDEFVQEFKSIQDAADSMDVTIQAIWNCCRGKSQSCCGYKWSYKN